MPKFFSAVLMLLLVLLEGSAAGSDGGQAEVTLAEAIVAEHDSLVAVLIERGEGLDGVLADYFGATPLMLAVERDDRALARDLLEAGARVNMRDRNRDTALNWASYYGFLDMARLLLEHGGDPGLAGHGNALQIALRRGHEDLAQLLGKAMGLQRPGPGWTEALASAVGADEGPAVVKALQDGARTEALDALGRPVLHLAARMGSLGAAAALLEKGAPVDQRDEQGMTALMLAAREGRQQMVRLLLKSGADPQLVAHDPANNLGPLHFAAIGGDQAIVAELLARGAAPDGRDRDGVTPMMWALAEGHIPVVIDLIARGADPTIRNNDGDSVAGIARRYGIEPILAAMEGGRQEGR